MSRMYSIQFTVSGFNQDRVAAISEAVNELGIGFDVIHSGHIIDSSKEDITLSVCHEPPWNSEEGVARLLTEAIWRANGAFCVVKVYTVDMDLIPCETHELGEDAYEAKMDLAG